MIFSRKPKMEDEEALIGGPSRHHEDQDITLTRLQPVASYRTDEVSAWESFITHPEDHSSRVNPRNAQRGAVEGVGNRPVRATWLARARARPQFRESWFCWRLPEEGKERKLVLVAVLLFFMGGVFLITALV